MTLRERNSGDLLEISGYFWKTCALHAAVRLEVFSIIGGGPLFPALFSLNMLLSAENGQAYPKNQIMESVTADY